MRDRPDPFERWAKSPSMIHRFLAGGLLGLVCPWGCAPPAWSMTRATPSSRRQA